MEVTTTAFANELNLNTKWGKYILKKNFKTIELINLKSQQYVKLDGNKALQQQMATKVSVASPQHSKMATKVSVVHRRSQ